MIHGYPYTDFHELNLDWLMKLARETMGLRLKVEDDFLKLVNAEGNELSKVTITYAEKALNDVHGNPIDAYFLSADTDATHVILTRGDGTAVTLTVPYATKALEDVDGKAIKSYVHGVGVSGNKINVTFGDGTTYQFTVPFATKAEGDKNGKDITTYVADISVNGDDLIVTDGAGHELSVITVPYAVKALKDVDGDPIKTTYAHSLVAGTTTVILKDKVGNDLSEITVPYATKALTDTDGNAFLSDYAEKIVVYGQKVGLEAHDGTKLNEITVPFATLSTDATNAIESVTISGDKVVFTTYGGQTIEITVPYAVKALKDNLNNTLSETYIANAVNDPLTGKITFYAQDGSVIAEMTPTVDKAVHDSYNNLIADYIKAIVTSPNSDYVTVTHGTGTTDSITIEYATRAWKDTYGNIIGNVYIRSLAIDTVGGVDYLVAYNGELSELFRLALPSAVVASLADIGDVNITSATDGDILQYDANDSEWKNVALPTVPTTLDDLTDIDITSATDGDIIVYDGNNNEWVNQAMPTVPDELNDLTDVNITSATDGDILQYDANDDEWKNVALPTVPTDLDDLSDVVITSATDGDVLSYDGNSSEWVNTPPNTKVCTAYDLLNSSKNFDFSTLLGMTVGQSVVNWGLYKPSDHVNKKTIYSLYVAYKNLSSADIQIAPLMINYFKNAFDDVHFVYITGFSWYSNTGVGFTFTLCNQSGQPMSFIMYDDINTNTVGITRLS